MWGRIKPESDKRVREVHAAVERACSRANGSGLRHDPRFHPHVTLARVKTRKNTTSEERTRLAEFAKDLVKGECQGAGEFESLVAGVSLMEVKLSGLHDDRSDALSVFWGLVHIPSSSPSP